MNKILTLSLLSLAFMTPAHASDFQFCDMEGTIESVILQPGNRDRVFRLSVGVSSAKPDTRTTHGYTDCSEYVGNTIVFQLQLPKQLGQPSTGDFISFNYSAVDGFDSNGEFAGTSINISLRGYKSASRQNGR